MRNYTEKRAFLLFEKEATVTETHHSFSVFTQ